MSFRIPLVLVFCFAAACGDSPTSSPASTKGGSVGEQAAALERIVVTAATEGWYRESDSYIVFVDGQLRGSIGPNGQLAVQALRPTSHAVALSGVPKNCAMLSPNPRVVTRSPGVVGTAAFSVHCGSGQTRIRVTTRTSFPLGGQFGRSLTVELDGNEQQQVDLNGVAVFLDVAPGIHTVRLTKRPPGCGSFGGPDYFTRTINVVRGFEAVVAFDVVCLG